VHASIQIIRRCRDLGRARKAHAKTWSQVSWFLVPRISNPGCHHYNRLSPAVGSLAVGRCMSLVATHAQVAWIACFKRGGRMLFPLPARCDSGWNHGRAEEEETAEKDCEGAFNAGVPNRSTVSTMHWHPHRLKRTFHDHVFAALSYSVGTHRRLFPRHVGEVRLLRAGARGPCARRS
jgi:hypothetical protein